MDFFSQSGKNPKIYRRYSRITRIFKDRFSSQNKGVALYANKKYLDLQGKQNSADQSTIIKHRAIKSIKIHELPFNKCTNTRETLTLKSCLQSNGGSLELIRCKFIPKCEVYSPAKSGDARFQQRDQRRTSKTETSRSKPSISRSSLRRRQMSPVYFASSSAKREMAQTVVPIGLCWSLASSVFRRNYEPSRDFIWDFNSKMAAARILSQNTTGFLDISPKTLAKVCRSRYTREMHLRNDFQAKIRGSRYMRDRVIREDIRYVSNTRLKIVTNMNFKNMAGNAPYCFIRCTNPSSAWNKWGQVDVDNGFCYKWERIKKTTKYLCISWCPPCPYISVLKHHKQSAPL